jgi:hypothetical protein
MSDFNLGFVFGAISIGLIVSPFLTYFAVVYHNIIRMEKRVLKEMPKEISTEIPDEIKSTIEQAEKLLKERNVI